MQIKRRLYLLASKIRNKCYEKKTANFDTTIITIVFMITSLLLMSSLVIWPVMASSHISHISNRTIQQSPLIPLSGINQKSIYNGINNTSKVVILTFGDGYQSQYIYAKPVLDKYGFKANFFVTCNRIGTNSHMTWQEVEQLYKEGHVIGSKTMDYGTKAMQNTRSKSFIC